MSASTLKIGAIVMAMSAALLSHVATAAAQVGTKPPEAAAQPPQAAGKQIRVKLSLEVTGSFQHNGPKVVPKGAMYLPIKLALNNSYTTEYVVVPETILTGLQKINPLEPASQKEMDDYNTKVKAQADRVYHSADNLRKPGAVSSSGRSGMNPMAMMNPEMMQKIMACGNDKACQQRVAMEMMSQQMQSGPGAQAQAAVQAISNVCINEKHQRMGTKGYEQCMDAEGAKRSSVSRSAADDEPEVPELPDRYLLYSNLTAATEKGQFKDCQFKAHAKVNESSTYGGISDGEGGGNYGEGSGTKKGEGNYKQKAELVQSNLTPCSSAQVVFDTKTGTFWGGFLSIVEVELVSTGSNGGSLGSMVDTRQIEAWVQSALQGAPASGTKTQAFGFQTAKLTWSFVRE